MSHLPKVSVVTTTYNHEKFIAQALDSFLSQVTNFNVEIIVADDHSSDRTPVIVREYADAHPSRIQAVLRTQNVGTVRNTMGSIRRARGDYLAICNGDDYWTDTTKLQRQADLLDARPELAFCFHRARVVDESQVDRDLTIPDPDQAPEFTLDRLLMDNFVPNNSVMYRRRNYDDLPDEVWPPDWYLHMYHATFGDIGFLDRVMSVYRMHPGGVWASTEDDQDRRWAVHGIKLLGMQVAAQDLYKADAPRSAILQRAMTETFRRIGQADRSAAQGLLQEAVERFPARAADTISSLHQNATSSAQAIDALVGRLDVLESENIELQSTLAVVRRRAKKLQRQANRRASTPTLPFAQRVVRRVRRGAASRVAQCRSSLARLRDRNRA